MAFKLDDRRLFLAFAHALHRQILPQLEAAEPRHIAGAALTLAAYAALPKEETAEPAALGETVRALLDKPDPEAGLSALLAEEARSYRAATDALNALLASIAETVPATLPRPDATTIETYLAERHPDWNARVENVSVAVGGYSKQTVLFDMIRGGVTEPLVMRRDLSVANIGTSVVDEYDILRAVFEAGFPVAEPLWLDATGTAALPGPFLVSRKVDGQVTGNPLGITRSVDFAPAQVIATLLADLHALDVDALDVPGFSHIALDVAVQRARIAEWRAKYEGSVGDRKAVLEIGLAWLDRNAHLALGPKVLVHGEVGFHNLLLQDGKAMALLDWELTHFGNAADDLAYVRRCVEPYEAFDVFLQRYVDAGGRPPQAHSLAYFEIFGSVRNAILGELGMSVFRQHAHHDLPLVRIILETTASYVATLSDLLTRTMAEHGFDWQLEGQA